MKEETRLIIGCQKGRYEHSGNLTFTNQILKFDDSIEYIDDDGSIECEIYEIEQPIRKGETEPDILMKIRPGVSYGDLRKFLLKILTSEIRDALKPNMAGDEK